MHLNIADQAILVVYFGFHHRSPHLDLPISKELDGRDANMDVRT